MRGECSEGESVVRGVCRSAWVEWEVVWEGTL